MDKPSDRAIAEAFREEFAAMTDAFPDDNLVAGSLHGIIARARELDVLASQPAVGESVPMAEHMELKLRATDLCERLRALVVAMYSLGDCDNMNFGGRPVRDIVPDLYAAETAKEMLAALAGKAEGE